VNSESGLTHGDHEIITKRMLLAPAQAHHRHVVLEFSFVFILILWDQQGSEAFDIGPGQRCGGKGWHASGVCAPGLFCNHTNEYWWDCQQDDDAREAAPALSSPVMSGLLSSAGLPPSIAELNQRFRAGQPSNSLDTVGVLLHQFHDGADGDWKPWLPCPSTCYGHDCWCSRFSDRFSVTIANARMAKAVGKLELYSENNPGFVLAPWAMKVKCAFPADGGTESKQCDPKDSSCEPGCGRTWCDPNDGGIGLNTICAWRPEELQEVLSRQENAGSAYNEVVVDEQKWVQNLPSTIQAVFYLKGSDGERDAREVHSMFVEEFEQLSLAARDALLVELDPSNLEAPFQLAPYLNVEQKDQRKLDKGHIKDSSRGKPPLETAWFIGMGAAGVMTVLAFTAHAIHTKRSCRYERQLDGSNDLEQLLPDGEVLCRL